MNGTITLLVALLVAFVVGRAVDRLAARWITPSGAEYLLLGVALGPASPVPLLGEAELARLDPLVGVLLGILGLSLGLRAKQVLGRLDQVIAGSLLAIGVAGLVGLAAGTLVPLLVLEPIGSPLVLERTLFSLWGWDVQLVASERLVHACLCLGAAAAVGSTAISDRVLTRLGAPSSLGELTRVMTTSATVAAVLLFGIGLASARAGEAGRWTLGATEWGLLVTVISVLCGALFRLFLGQESSTSRIFLATVGLVAFSSGVGSALGVSPMFVNTVAGLIVATTSDPSRVQRELDRLERPLFVLIMLLAGARWSPPGELAPWLLAGALLVVRVVGVHVVSWLAVRVALDRAPSQGVGGAFLGQGPLAVAIGTFASSRFPELQHTVLTAVLVSVLVCDLFSERVLERLLRSAPQESA